MTDRLQLLKWAGAIVAGLCATVANPAHGRAPLMVGAVGFATFFAASVMMERRRLREESATYVDCPRCGGTGKVRRSERCES